MEADMTEQTEGLRFADGCIGEHRPDRNPICAQHLAPSTEQAEGTRVMTEQTEGAEVEALAAHLDRWERGHDGANETDHWADRLARAILASDWLAARIAAAEQRGQEDNADHAMCYPHGSKALEALIAEAEARGAARVLAAVEVLVSSWEAGNESYGAGDREWNRTAALRALVDAARAATGGGS